MLTDLRGDISLKAGSVGVITPVSIGGNNTDPADPRAVDYRTVEVTQNSGGPILVPGDGTATVATRGDLVLGGASDAGMTAPVDPNGMQYNPGGGIINQGGDSRFTLWTSTTAIDLYAAGGNLSPGAASATVDFYPGTFLATAASGNLYFSPPLSAGGGALPIELAPSPVGQLSLLAAGSIYGDGSTIAMSVPTLVRSRRPLNSVFGLIAGGRFGLTNADPSSPYTGISRSNPIAFGPDTPTTNLHESDPQPGLVYAGDDIVDLGIGYSQTFSDGVNSFFPTPSTWYYAAKPFQIIAGRDIVGGAVPRTGGPAPADFIMNDGPDDVSIVHAGRDIFFQSIPIAGPDLLDVEAGRNVNQGSLGKLESVGPLVNLNAGNASIGAEHFGDGRCRGFGTRLYRFRQALLRCR